VVWLFLRTFLLEAFRIPSGSMENTLMIGDFLFVNKMLYGAEVPFIGKRLPAVREPQRDDVVVFDSVEEEGLKVVKRLVGMPGDTLAMEGGAVPQRAEGGRAMGQAQQPEAGADAFYRAKMRSGRSTTWSRLISYDPNLQDQPIVCRGTTREGYNWDDSYDGRYWGFCRGEKSEAPAVHLSAST
jgi:signal peptidase I